MMNISLFTNQQLTVVGVLVIAVAWYAQRKAGNAIEGAVDSVIGFDGLLGFLWDTDTDIELTEEAEERRARFIRLGYLEVDERGVDVITPEGHAYLERQRALKNSGGAEWGG